VPGAEKTIDDAHGSELVSSLRLSLVSGVGPRLRQALLDRFGTAEAVRSATAAELRGVSGVGEKVCRAIITAHDQIDAAAELDCCQRHGIAVLTQADTDYPRLLREIHDPPGVLFAKGKLAPQDGLAIGIVGTRHATRYGLQQAGRLAAGLARTGLTIISGLARGIDAAAHRGALEAGGRTIAVLGGGLARLYPPEHIELAHEITAAGALLSEAPPRSEPLGGMFPQRNRLISGLSLGVIIVEAPSRSGALITARHANEQGREVFAVPGPVDSRNSRGCHRLIRDGAKLVESIDDVLEELGPLVESTPDEDGRPIRNPAELQLNDLERRVLDHIETRSTRIDHVVVATGLSAQQVLSTINVLEIRRLIDRVSGHSVARR
jgi:DNA processing protein